MVAISLLSAAIAGFAGLAVAAPSEVKRVEPGFKIDGQPASDAAQSYGSPAAYGAPSQTYAQSSSKQSPYAAPSYTPDSPYVPGSYNTPGSQSPYKGKPTQAPTYTQTASNNGFPVPTGQALLNLEQTADGTLSNAGAPPKLANTTLNAFQLILFNENFEVAFFQSLLNNVTAGYDNSYNYDKDTLIKILEKVVAQETLHAINAEILLNKFGVFAPPPCVYKFPTVKVEDAIQLASTFTDVVLGTLQDASQLLSTNGDNGAVRAVASVIGQEGEQNGFYRLFLDRVPSEKPFLTTSVADFAFSALQQFIVTCPFDIKQLPFTNFTALNVLTGANGGDVQPMDQELEFSVDFSKIAGGQGMSYVGKSTVNNLFVTYLIGQNKPDSRPVTDLTWKGNVATFKAFFPFEDNVAFGLSIAALTSSSNFTTPDDVPKATLAAPGLIEVNDKL